MKEYKGRFVLASNNKGKIKEFKEMFEGYEILTLNDVGFYDDIVEDGDTFLANSLIKARTVTKYLKEKGIKASVIADDSGLCVNALDGRPGIYSTRSAGGHGNDEANRKKVLDELKDKTDRTAYFECVIVKMEEDESYEVFEGKTFGEISKEEVGNRDFCFDCIFYSTEINKSFGLASSEDKNSVSHRGRAIEKLKQSLKNN